ncbi:hypothetical protein EYZ11_005078 [Aspergillus tanneri]|uniref:ASTRA-associated protein 1 n=1 Tax=Aspergillus tanneri TaxID=1220188 RepID=A0A4S3JIU8_9EURO|nr:ASTRA complex subunit [Aspergillus tanneri]KAA8652449.1 ASTRA complex subunit [Aspergillus tanneri]THC95436.1 hypothetical protein EYZ11_005078 [Aspergillus tanneri]
MSISSPPHLPPATPTYILRGHTAPIHGLHVFHHNLRLISGDANGWIVIWDLVSKRPVAVWKAHEGALLEVKGFTLDDGVTEIYTHGRDHKLRVWKFRPQDEDILSKTLPVDTGEKWSGNQPWMVHSLHVNALNFCAFAMLFVGGGLEKTPNTDADAVTDMRSSPLEETKKSSVLIAVPNALDSGAIDVFHLPLERRLCTIPPSVKTGMVMAVSLFFSSSGDMYIASAYEDGHVMVFARRGPFNPDVSCNPSDWKWELLYICRAHTQPALSIDVSATRDYFFSSSADAVLVKHPVPCLGRGSHSHSQGGVSPDEKPLKMINTKHAGQQSLRVRSDVRIFATAGWDSRVRVYSCRTLKELAVLKWHKEGCYAVAFAEVLASMNDGASTDGKGELQGELQGDGGNDGQLTRREGEFSLASVQRQRNHKVQGTHWLAVGSKDGKISLWDIY